MEKVIRARLLVVAGLLIITWLAWLPELLETTDKDQVVTALLSSSFCPENVLCVAFLDVGQGDAIFIQSPVGQQMLVDGGRDSAILRQLGRSMSFWDKQLDYVVLTHPDADHIGGLVEVFDRYTVDKVIRTDKESDTEVWKALELAIENENSKVIYAKRGQRFDLGNGVVVEILFPELDVTNEESNTSSIVAKLSYGEHSFLLTGDSPKAIEEYLVLIDSDYLNSEVLKVGHHGSRTSSSEMFVDAVSPRYAVISAGTDNQYDHPHVEVTDLLFNKGIQTLSTAELGTIVFTSDGKNLKVK